MSDAPRVVFEWPLAVGLAEPAPPAIGHNHPPPDERDLEIARLKQKIEELGIRGYIALSNQRQKLMAPRRTALRKYRQTHKAELAQRQREYRYYHAAARLEQEAPYLSYEAKQQREKKLRQQYERMIIGDHVSFKQSA